MNTTGITFLFVFLPILIIVYYNPIIKNRKFKNVLLLLASLYFYVCLEPIMVILLLGTILVNYIGVMYFIKTNKKAFKVLPIIIDFVLLLGFKYINLVLNEIGLLMNSTIEFAKIAMPLGVSYYTFNAVSYVLDASKTGNAGSLLDTALYISFFGKMSSGPIVQYDNMIGEIKDRNESFDMFCLGFQRFCMGLVKKILIADSIAGVVSECFDNSVTKLSVTTAWLGAIAYTLQIYFDFSGCTDMAIGLGNIFGFNFSENFNYPYSAVSVSDFWKRWHISLTKWFTKYIYIPLGGNRVSKSRHILNMAVVWLFTGVWHGANWTFMIWGMLYFVFLLLEKYTNLKKFMENHKVLGHIYTLIIVVLLWVIFRANSATDAFKYIGTMFGIGASSFYDESVKKLFASIWITLIVGAIFALPVKDTLIAKLPKSEKAINILYNVVILVFAVLAICVCVTNGKGSVSLYANF